MKTTRLGRSGLEISPVILGMMSYGDPKQGGHAWTLGLEDARPLVRRAYEAGITTFDTANVYSAGTSEQITGTLVRELGPRENVQILTKVHGRMRTGANGAGLSRAAIMAEIDASLSRLGTDYVDLFQIHRFDPTVPIEETMEALHDVVKAGKARYIGASSMWAWQFAQMQHVAALRGWTGFVSMQDQYNLLQREEEREMHPYCQATGIGVIPWSPLARGKVARPWGSSGSGDREANDDFIRDLYRQQERADEGVVNAVENIAASRGVPMAQVALAWVMGKDGITAPIIGATKEHHVTDAVGALSLHLSAEETSQVEASYCPRDPTGF